MTLRRVRVECYAGTRSDETPRRIRVEGQEYAVASLLAESVEESLASNEQTRRFRVLTDKALILELVRSSDGNWYLESTLPIEPGP